MAYTLTETLTVTEALMVVAIGGGCGLVAVLITLRSPHSRVYGQLASAAAVCIALAVLASG